MESRSTGIWAQKHGNKVETAVRIIIGGLGWNGKVEGEKISFGWPSIKEGK